MYSFERLLKVVDFLCFYQLLASEGILFLVGFCVRACMVKFVTTISYKPLVGILPKLHPGTV